MIFNMTGGGAPLNFKVVPNPQPDTAKENTIWVDTDRINNYYFSATQPENMVNYDVWFHVGTSSSVEFNALKKNGIQVYPISAKQYIGGAWVDKTVKSYHNGAWVNWIHLNYVFYYGKQIYPWQTRGWEMSSSYTAKAPTATTNSDGSVTLLMPYSSTRFSGVYELVNDFDVTKYNKLTLDATCNQQGLYLAVVKRSSTYCHTDAAAIVSLDSSKTLSISALTGSYDIVLILRVGIASEGTSSKQIIFKSLIAE